MSEADGGSTGRPAGDPPRPTGPTPDGVPANGFDGPAPGLELPGPAPRGGPAEPVAGPDGNRWWLRPDARVSALGLALAAATLGAVAALSSGGVNLPSGTHLAWLPALVLMCALTEGFAVHVQVRRGAHAMSVSEIPMVFAVLTLHPVLAILARIIGGGAGLVLLRRQRGAKLAFNLALLGVQASVAAGTFHLIGGRVGQVGTREWLAAYAAMVLADVVAVVLITAAISLHDDPSEWRRLGRSLRSVPVVLVVTTVALVSMLAVNRNEWAVLLLAAVSVGMYFAFRAYVRANQGHTRVEELYAFTRALEGSSDLSDVVRIALDQARDQLRADCAELYIPPLIGRPPVKVSMSGLGTFQRVEGPPGPADAWWTPATWGEPVLLPAGGGRRSEAAQLPVDGMAVPVPFADKCGALIVTGSLPDIETFDEKQLRLFQAFANHASVSLARVHLMDRLRREAEEKEHLALHDPLTGLPNRRQYQELLDRALDAARHDDNGPAVILLDLDRFKEINDALGHDTGDALLLELGRRLQRRLAEGRPGPEPAGAHAAFHGGEARVARLGGDEFAILIPRVHSVDEAVGVAFDLGREVERPVQLGPLTLNARASIGVAVAPVHGDDTQTLLRRADVAMYAAKDGRSSPRVYVPEDDQNTPHRLALIADLREAIQRRDLLVVFQPKLDPHTGQVTGAEALARWHHAEYGNIPPDQFIPLAEHSGLIRRLTLHVLEVALRRCAAWRRAGHDLNVAVNLSAVELHDSELPELVDRMLQQTRNPASALTLEITESSLMADMVASMATLNGLHGLGVKLSIDDFGTGYSSLGRLRELPIHEVKIDKSFVQRVAVDPRDRAVVRSAVQLGHALDLEVVAEGVEDVDTYAYLAREGCNLVQGYLVSKPLPPDEFAVWLASREAGNVIHHRFTA